MEKQIRLIAVDMDGTLLRSDQTLDPETLRDLRYAADRGMEIVLCTGRAPAEMRDFDGLLPMVRYAVCSSGALVRDLKEKKSICRFEIGQTLIVKAMKTARKYGAMPQFLTEEESVVSAADILRMKEFGMGAYQDLYLRTARQAESMEAESRLHASVSKFNIYFRSGGDRAAAFEELKDLPLTFAFSGTSALEMTALGVTKAFGLMVLAEHLGIPAAQTAGIGDSDNDRPMLEAVGLSAAMGNASAEIRNSCGMVTEDNDHNGAGKAVRRILEYYGRSSGQGE